MSLRERKRQAAQGHVADAAAALFVRDGYLATTTRKVAEAAQVAEGTIFNLFESKAGLLLAALQRAVPDPPTVADWIDEARDLSGPGEVIDLFTHVDTRVASGALPLARVFLEAAGADHVVAEAWRTQENHRLEDQKWLLKVLAERGWLRTDRRFDDLARDLWIVAAPETHLKCRDAGMSEQDFHRWESGVLGALLLEPNEG